MGTKYYIICSFYRSGTNFLKSLMRGVPCGLPNEHLRHLFKATGDNAINDIETLYDKGLKGGVWGGMFYWLNYTPAMKKLKEISGFGEDTDDFEVLNNIFPGVKFIYLYRLNKVKQAISFIKHQQCKDPSGYKYDASRIKTVISEIVKADAHWMIFFQKYNIVPHFLTYESLCKNKVKAISNILDFLEIQFVSDISLEDHINNIRVTDRQYDAINEEWYQRFLNI